MIEFEHQEHRPTPAPVQTSKDFDAQDYYYDLMQETAEREFLRLGQHNRRAPRLSDESRW